MKTMKRISKFIFCIILFALFIFFIFLTPSAFSLGMSPGMETFLFQPNMVHSSEIKLIGETEPFAAKITPTGDLEQYITVSTDTIIVPPEGSSFSYTMSLPETLKPGKYKTSIVIEKQASVSADGAGKSQFGALGALGYVLLVTVPYEGKYAEAKIEATNSNIGRPVDFTVRVMNYGNESIALAQGNITTYDVNGNSVGTVQTDAASILTGGTAELYSHWTPKNVSLGVYRAKVVVTYDGMETEAETSFQIGDLALDILDMAPKELEQGTINKFSITVQSYWSATIANVYATITLRKENENTPLDVVTTAPISVDLWQANAVVGYWDATKRELGNYTAEVVLYYADKTTAKNFTIALVPASEEQPVSEIAAPSSLFSFSPEIVTIGFFGIIALLILLYFLRKLLLQKPKKMEKKEKIKKEEKVWTMRKWSRLEIVLLGIIAVLLSGILFLYFTSSQQNGITGSVPAVSELSPAPVVSASTIGQEASLFDILNFVLLLSILALLLSNGEVSLRVKKNLYYPGKIFFLNRMIAYLHEKELAMKEELKALQNAPSLSSSFFSQKKRIRKRKTRGALQTAQQQEASVKEEAFAAKTIPSSSTTSSFSPEKETNDEKKISTGKEKEDAP